MRTLHVIVKSLCASLLMALAGAAAAHPQNVVMTGRGDADHDLYLRRLVTSRDYVLFAQDTLVARTDTVRGTALVLGATLRLDGVVTGDLVIVDGNAFIRPTAVVLGSVRNISGGLFASDRATVQGGTRSDPNAPYRVDVRGDTLVIVGTAQRLPFVLHGFSGVLIPTYDRVDGLTAGVGGALLLPRVETIEPRLDAHLEYRTERGEFTGGGELAFARRRTEVAFGAERTTLTNERWIHSDLTNSITSLVLAKDRRDYFEADRGYVELRRLLERGARVTNVFIRGQVEDATPLPAREPWSIRGSFRDDNMEFPASRITSGIAGMNLLWHHPSHVVSAQGALELAGELLDGEHSFAGWVADLDWAMSALANHTLRIDVHGQGPLPGTDSLPGQRWSFVGGDGTLFTYDDAEFRGDRVAFVATEYIIPLPRRLTLRVLGRPTLDLLHFAGMAWSNNVSRRFQQNIGARLSYNVVFLRVVTHPDRLKDDAEFAVGFRFPRRAYPWELSR